MAVHVNGPIQGNPGSLSPLTMAMLGGLVLVLVSGFLLLVLTNHDTSTYILFVAGPLVTTVVGALLGQRVKVVEEVAKTVEAQTNGLLSTHIAQLHEHIDEQTNQLLDEPSAVTQSPGSSSGATRVPAQQAPAAAERLNR